MLTVRSRGYRAPLRFVLLAVAVLGVVATIGIEPATSRLNPSLPSKYHFTYFDYPHAVGTTLFGINDAGQVVGYYSRTSTAGDVGNTPVQGFMLNEHTMTAAKVTVATARLPTALRRRLGVIKNVTTVGIAQDGRVVGFFTGNGGRYYGFVRSTDGKTFTIIDDSAGNGTNAFAMNARGQVTGFFVDRRSKQTPSANGRIIHGFVLSADGKRFTKFDDPKGRGKTFASDIDNEGRIVGHYVDRTGAVIAFVRSADGKFTSFTHPLARVAGGGTCGQRFDLRGDVAGFYFTPTGTHGYVRAADGKHFNVIDAPRGKGRTYVFGINDRGQVVGDYVDASGNNHGFIGTPIG